MPRLLDLMSVAPRASPVLPGRTRQLRPPAAGLFGASAQIADCRGFSRSWEDRARRWRPAAGLIAAVTGAASAWLPPPGAGPRPRTRGWLATRRPRKPGGMVKGGSGRAKSDLSTTISGTRSILRSSSSSVPRRRAAACYRVRGVSGPLGSAPGPPGAVGGTSGSAPGPPGAVGGTSVSRPVSTPGRSGAVGGTSGSTPGSAAGPTGAVGGTSGSTPGSAAGPTGAVGGRSCARADQRS